MKKGELTDHGGTQDGGADTPPETKEAVGFENGAEGIIRVFVVVLGANGDMGRVGLHTRLDKEQRGAERCFRFRSVEGISARGKKYLRYSR